MLKAWKVTGGLSGVIPGVLPNKSNARRIVRWGDRIASIKSQDARSWTNSAMLYLLEAKRLSTFTKNDKLALSVVVYQENMRRDLDIELLCDALQKAGVIPNDRAIFYKEARRRIDQTNPRSEWTLTVWEDVL